MANYNAILILEAIAKAPIPDEVKLKAVKDINRMHQDKEYGRKCNALRDEYSDNYETPILAAHHWFHESDLGSGFWHKMDEILRS